MLPSFICASLYCWESSPYRSAIFSRTVSLILVLMPSTARARSSGRRMVSILLTRKMRRPRSLLISLLRTNSASLMLNGLPGTMTIMTASSLGMTSSLILFMRSSSLRPGVSTMSTPF